MKKLAPATFIGIVAAFAAVPLQAQILANAANDFQAGTIGSVMTSLSDTQGTGTWTYDLGFVNSTSNPTSFSGNELLTYINNNVNGDAGGDPYYGTTSSNSYNVIGLPSVSNSRIFDDSPAPAAGYLEVHPGSENAATVVEWTAGADEIGTLQLMFDLSRVGVNGNGAGDGQGYDDFTVYQNGSLLYSNYAMFIGSDTGMQTFTLTGVTDGTKLDFVSSATSGALGYNLGYLNAQISEVAVPEPATWALMLGSLGLLVLVQRTRKDNVLH